MKITLMLYYILNKEPLLYQTLFTMMILKTKIGKTNTLQMVQIVFYRGSEIVEYVVIVHMVA